MFKRLRIPGLVFLAALALGLILFVRFLLSKMRSVEKDQTVLDIIEALCQDYGLPVSLAKAVIKQESDWDPNAYNPPSPSNALAGYGLMQISTMVAQDFGLVKDWRNPTPEEIQIVYVPYYNLKAGLGNLAKFYSRYPIEVAVEMYNVGEDGYNDHGWRNPEYVAGVMGYYQDYGVINA